MVKTYLFKDLNEKEYKKLERLNCLKEKEYKSNTYVFKVNDLIHEIGIVVDGSLNIENIDYLGNKTILSNLNSGDVFGETYALSKEKMMVDVITLRKSVILFFDVDVLFDERYKKESWRDKIMNNLLSISSYKNLALSNRIFFTSFKKIRDKLMAYFSYLSIKNNSKTFSVPFDRQGLADYLNVDRSALSKELCKMRDDGVIEFYKNSIKLL